jgi:hypothetical protein
MNKVPEQGETKNKQKRKTHTGMNKVPISRNNRAMTSSQLTSSAPNDWYR